MQLDLEEEEKFTTDQHIIGENQDNFMFTKFSTDLEGFKNPIPSEF